MIMVVGVNQVETISRRLFVYLAVLVLEMVVGSSIASATTRKLDFYVYLSNPMNQPTEFCNSDLTYCELIPAGGQFSDAQATSGHAADYLRPWIASAVLRASGKIVPLERLVDPAVIRPKPNGTVEFQLLIDKEKYLKEFLDGRDNRRVFKFPPRESRQSQFGALMR